VKFGVVVFPGTWSDRDCGHVVEDVLGAELVYLWHKDRDLHGADCVILPGGFSYGDYLRAGAIARFSPVMESVAAFAARGGLVWGICNGFQVLCEAGLLPGALVRNDCLEFRCEWTHLRCERDLTPFTGCLTRGQVVHVPISAEHRRHRQRARQRAGHDAAPRAVRRGRPGRHGRPAPVPLGAGGGVGGDVVTLFRTTKARRTHASFVAFVPSWLPNPLRPGHDR
jgi:phosphoribosylformylglycinamidine synthase